ncbi:MAG: Hsp70 family protein [Thermodesulfobacteriota bacterium]
MIESTGPLKEAVKSIENISSPEEKARILLNTIREAPKNAESLPLFNETLKLIKTLEPADERRIALQAFIKELPLTSAFIDTYKESIVAVIDAIEHIADPRAKKTLLTHIADGLPNDPDLAPYFKDAIKRAIEAANEIDDPSIRRNSLALIMERLPKEESLSDLSLYAMELALGLSDSPLAKKNTLEDIAFELPRTCDHEFYRKNTFIGVIQRLPKTTKFSPLYKLAIETAIEAAHTIDEPYYVKYALIFISEELPKDEEFHYLYRKSLLGALKASLEIIDPFVRHFSLMEMLVDLPKTREFYPQIMEAIENMLPFYSVKSRMDNVDVLEVIDYIIVAEERKFTESKKKRYNRVNYGIKFAKLLEKFMPAINDIRFIEIFKPYTHVWVHPPALRDAAKKFIAHLEGLQEQFHGSEVTRPQLMREAHPDWEAHLQKRLEEAPREANDTIAIDLGATNTIIMKKRISSDPHFINLSLISKKLGDIDSVPTIVSTEGDTVGTEALDSNPVINLKKLLLSGNPKGREYMEKYFHLLYKHLKVELTPKGWLNILSNAPRETFYLTVPVGFQGYRKDLLDIAKKSAKGIKVDFIEEPLAAAIGYQVAEERDKIVLIIDFGGCTLDVMVLRINLKTVNVIAKPDRSQMIGGSDIDFWLAEKLAEKVGIKTDEIPNSLLHVAEQMKIALSSQASVPFEWDGSEICSLNVEEFEEILDARDFYKSIDRAVSYVLKKTAKLGVPRDKIEAVLITGGSSQMPSFKDKIAHIFPELKKENAIFDHSPLSAVVTGAAYYGTREITDRHLTVAYAIKHITENKERPFSHELIFEKGEHLPFEKTFKMKPGKTLGTQKEFFLELFEVPDAMITRRWESEAGLEFIRQVLKQPEATGLNAFKIITLPFTEEIEDEIEITFKVDESGRLTVHCMGDENVVDSGVRLQ